MPDPDNEIAPTKKPKNHHNKTRGGPCEPLQNEPFVNIEFVKHGKPEIILIMCTFFFLLPSRASASCAFFVLPPVR